MEASLLQALQADFVMMEHRPCATAIRCPSEVPRISDIGAVTKGCRC